MRQFPALTLTCLAVFFAFSCAGVEPAKRYPDMVADADPVSAGSVEIMLERPFSTKLNKIEAEVLFYPRLNSVALEFKYDLILHRQFWDTTGRQQFAAALEQDKEDYAARSLQTQYRRTRAVYGKTRGRVEWEVFSFLKKINSAQPVIEIGYRFMEGSPFFATLMRSEKEDKTIGDNPLESQQINMYFTRAQADELVRLFDSEYLMGLLGIVESVSQEEQEQEPEDYYTEFKN
jgi:hypothetical protein